MIPLSTSYKLVDCNHRIIAEGSAKLMHKLQKQNKGSMVWLSPDSKIGDYLGKKEQSDNFLQFAKNITDCPEKKKFVDNL